MNDDSPRKGPTWRSAGAWLACAALLTILMWAEHFWRLGRGDYPGIGMRHTWYWYVTNGAAGLALAAYLVVGVFKVIRWLRS